MAIFGIAKEENADSFPLAARMDFYKRRVKIKEASSAF